MSTGEHASRDTRHLIGTVQRFGLASAAAIVERYVETVDRALGSRTPGTPGALERVDGSSLLDGAARLAEAGARTLDTIADLVLDGAGRAAAIGPDDRLELPAASPGTRSEGSLWVHNPMPAGAADVDLRVTTLTAPTGWTIPVDAVSLSRSRVDVVDPHDRQEIRLRVDVPPDQPAGHYHGLVLSPAAPLEPLHVRFEVLPSEGSGP